MVRGGGPSENRFYLDGVEIPNINHFSTQGASGGPVGIIDADFIREVNFYTGAFPANRGNALSSVLDFKLLDGNTEKRTVKTTVGASEVSLTSNGYITKNKKQLIWYLCDSLICNFFSKCSICRFFPVIRMLSLKLRLVFLKLMS